MVDRKSLAMVRNSSKLLFFAFLFLSSVKEVNSCSKTQFKVVHADGSMSCENCEKCPPGQGLSHECGTNISSDAMVTCKGCPSGISFSSSYDTSSCTSCAAPCFKDQVVLQNCTPTNNVRCSKQCYSKDRYYDRMYVECRACSRCCGDDGDVVEDECRTKLGSSSNMICSFHSSVNRCDTTTVSVPHPTATTVVNNPTYSSTTPSDVTTPPHFVTQDDQESPQDLPNSQAGSLALPVGLSSVVFVLLCCGAFLLYRIRRRSGCSLFSVCDGDIETGSDHSNNVPEAATLMHERTEENLMKGDEVEAAMEVVQQGSSDPLLGKVPLTAQLTCECQKTKCSRKESKPLRTLLEDLILLQRICVVLDTHVPGCGYYNEVAAYYGYDHYQRKAILEKAVNGPSRALIEGLVARRTELTVEEFAVVVERKTSRMDVVKLLRDYDLMKENRKLVNN